MLQKIRLGELLLKKNLITGEQLDKALAKQRMEGGKLGKILVDLGYIKEPVILNLVAEQLNIPFIDLKHFPLNTDLVRQLPEAAARRFRAILLEEKEDVLLVGMADPQNVVAFDELSRVLKRPLKLAVISEGDLLHVLDLFYRRTQDISAFAKELSDEVEETQFDLANLGELQSDANDAPVVKLLKSVFEDAVQMRASDIHIEPDESVLRIRQRIDGVLHETIMEETQIAPALTLRLKLMAGLKIAERRLPQDGRFTINVKGKKIDVRLSTMPVSHGESVVMRLLERSAASMRLEQLGMPEHILNVVRRIIKLPHGMILVTGPTGSGKTSSLYSILNELNSKDVKIITVEDPTEYHLPRINQVQVNTQIDLTFARVLRAALRQDPDIIMVGEIRDMETAGIALRAAMTGHFVLATMHTNDAISSAMRLMDMQGEGYMLASALRAIMAQRLLRRICDNCTQPYTPTLVEKELLKSVDGENWPLKHGKGCQQCNYTGYKGRIGVYEILEFDEAVSAALRSNNLAEFMKKSQHKGFTTLFQGGLDLVKQGVTSLQEVMRVLMATIDEHEMTPKEKPATTGA